MDDTHKQPIVLFAGGGTGGHIYPNLAVLERLIEQGFTGIAEFIVSNRAIDLKVLANVPSDITIRPLPVRPFSSRPWHWPRFLGAWNGSLRVLKKLDAQRGRAAAVVATGGFVSGPPIVAASKVGTLTAMANLDAVPGIANRKLSTRATSVFSVYPHATLPNAKIIGLPLRRSAVGPESQAEARQLFNLDPDRQTLMITGGSQGAQSVNDSIIAWASRDHVCKLLQGWQVLHICGEDKSQGVEASYEKLGIRAYVTDFCHTMGHAWRAATLAISRSGAGSVAEAWANATPTVFLPYPHHNDNHQRLNAGPICATGGTLLLQDLKDPQANAEQLDQHALPLMNDPAALAEMSAKLQATKPTDGADVLAAWVLDQIKR